MDVIIDEFGKIFKQTIRLCYQEDSSSTIDSLKSIAKGFDVQVFKRTEFVLYVGLAILAGIVAACIIGCMCCCFSCCCCPVYENEFYSSSISSGSYSRQQDVQYNYYG